LQFAVPTDDNRIVTSTSFYQEPRAAGPFHPGALVIVTLNNPREKFWGAILDLSSQGLSIRGTDLASFDALAALIKGGDPFTSGVVFFPMHRVERMELDLPEGDIPSLSQRFVQHTGIEAGQVFAGELPTPRGGKAAR
jgi:hypothetical protein